jgi:hypothetical protein
VLGLRRIEGSGELPELAPELAVHRVPQLDGRRRRGSCHEQSERYRHRREAGAAAAPAADRSRGLKVHGQHWFRRVT